MFVKVFSIIFLLGLYQFFTLYYISKITVSSIKKSVSLGVIIPFCSKDLSVIKQTINNWNIQCVKNYDIDLILYYDTPTITLEELDINTCFKNVKLLYSNLTEEENVYPVAPSIMFYKLFLNKNLKTSLEHYTHLFLIELDIKVVKPNSFELLFELLQTSSRDFWIMGSSLLGNNFHKTSHNIKNWKMLNHINGNAVYKYNDYYFDRYVEYTKNKYENEYSYDVALWTTLNDFPYSWLINQKFGDKFIRDKFIVNLGFIDYNSFLDKDTLFVHGSTISSGAQKKNQIVQATIQTQKSFFETPFENLCVFIKNYSPVSEYTKLTVDSILKTNPNLIVIVATHLSELSKINDNKNVYYISFNSEEKLNNIELYADSYCDKDYILYVSPGNFFTDRILNKDIFSIDRKLIVDYIPINKNSTIVYNQNTYPIIEKSILQEARQFEISNNVLQDIFKAQSRGAVKLQYSSDWNERNILQDNVDVYDIPINREYKICFVNMKLYLNHKLDLLSYLKEKHTNPNICPYGYYHVIDSLLDPIKEIKNPEQTRNVRTEVKKPIIIKKTSDFSLYVPHKCGSSLHTYLLRSIKKIGKTVHICKSSTCDETIDNIFVKGPIRTVGDDVAVETPTNKLIIMRDPRDIIISEYWSYGFYHKEWSNDTNYVKSFQEQRKTIQENGMEWYINYRIPIIKEMTTSILKAHQVCKNCYFFSYAKVVEEPKSHVYNLVSAMNLEDFFPQIWDDCKDTFLRNNDVFTDSHHINNPEGKYWVSIDIKLQNLLNSTFSNEITFLEKL